MPIPVTCQCGQGFRAKENLAGKRVKCPKCGQSLTIPGGDQDAGGSTVSGELSLEDLMRMDAASPAMPQQPMPGQPLPGQPMPGQQMPLGQFGVPGPMPPAGGGFQTPMFGQPAARPAGGGNRGFILALCGLGGVALLAVVGIVLMFVLRGGDPPSVATNPSPPPANVDPVPPTSNVIPKNVNPPPQTGNGTPVDGYDTPEAALQGYLQAIRDEDVQTYAATMLVALGASAKDLQETLEQRDKKWDHHNAGEDWKTLLLHMKTSFVEQITQTQAIQSQGNQATIVVQYRDGTTQKTLDSSLTFVKGASGRWQMTLASEEAEKLAAAMIKRLPPISAPKATLRVALAEMYDKSPNVAGLRFPRDDTPPQAHLGYSWMTELLPYLGHESVYQRFDFEKIFMRGANRAAATTVIPQFLNPQDSRRQITQRSHYLGLAVTHFVGMSGIEDARNVVAATLPRSDPRAGMFGYDRLARPKEVTDGMSNTIMLIGVEMVKPWVQSGGATIRGAREPYFGKPWGANFGSRGRNGTMVLMGDGSARLIPQDVDPAVFRAMCTIHGADSVDLAPYPPQPKFFTKIN